jgi:5-methylcytosine-specific restriction protein A
MPQRMQKPCAHHGCPSLTRERYCPDHAKQEQQRYERQRGSARQRGYTSRWEKARTSYLRSHPLCVECEKEGIVTAAIVVDHIKPHKGNQALFWDTSNWQSLCKHHHDLKTATEDGRWG